MLPNRMLRLWGYLLRPSIRTGFMRTFPHYLQLLMAARLAWGGAGCSHVRLPASDPSGQRIFSGGSTTLVGPECPLFTRPASAPVTTTPAVKPPCTPPITAAPIVVQPVPVVAVPVVAV